MRATTCWWSDAYPDPKNRRQRDTSANWRYVVGASGREPEGAR